MNQYWDYKMLILIKSLWSTFPLVFFEQLKKSSFGTKQWTLKPVSLRHNPKHKHSSNRGVHSTSISTSISTGTWQWRRAQHKQKSKHKKNKRSCASCACAYACVKWEFAAVIARISMSESPSYYFTVSKRYGTGKRQLSNLRMPTYLCVC